MFAAVRIVNPLYGVGYGGSTVPAGVQGPQRAIRQRVFQLPVQAPYLRIAPSP